MAFTRTFGRSVAFAASLITALALTACGGSKEAAKPAGASNEERMIVLRMLQEKKISLEEAEKLLNALDR